MKILVKSVLIYLPSNKVYITENITRDARHTGLTALITNRYAHICKPQVDTSIINKYGRVT